MNIPSPYIEILHESIGSLTKSSKWLSHSYDNCIGLFGKEQLQEMDFVQLEALSSRFSRTLDVLCKQVLRGLDMIEYGESGTLIDILNHSIKREILPEDNLISRMKILRNLISHEYVPEALLEISRQVADFSPVLIEYCKKAIEYSQKYVSMEDI